MTLDVAQAQFAGGGPGYARVRMLGRARGAATAPPTLLIADGPTWRRIAPVPGTPVVAADAAFAVEFEVPLHLAVSDGAWWLEPGAAVAPAAGPEPALRARVDELATRVAALGDELAALRARVDPDAAPARDTAPVADGSPSPVAARVPRAARLRALRPGLPALLVAAGALAIGDAVATVVWQEPVSALWSAREQHALDEDLQQLD